MLGEKPPCPPFMLRPPFMLTLPLALCTESSRWLVKEWLGFMLPLMAILPNLADLEDLERSLAAFLSWDALDALLAPYTTPSTITNSSCTTSPSTRTSISGLNISIRAMLMTSSKKRVLQPLKGGHFRKISRYRCRRTFFLRVGGYLCRMSSSLVDSVWCSSSKYSRMSSVSDSGSSFCFENALSDSTRSRNTWEISSSATMTVVMEPRMKAFKRTEMRR
mmetsp:Transcript_24685/g.67246  ORF Transcript_24685/g.67246 Transcript_24685/m.67246 type:complete len:220 (-) Transcript_24685:943-1602(-)